jgi:serine protease Do
MTRMRWALAPLTLAALASAGSSFGAPQERRFEIVHIGSGAYLGVTLGDVAKDDVARLKLPAERGALVKSVEAASPAAQAGLETGDVVLRYEGETVESAAALARMVRETPPGRQVSIEISRAGAVQRLQATVAERGGRDGGFEGLGRGNFDFTLPEAPEPPEPPAMPRLLWRERAPRKLGVEYQEVSDQLAKYFKLSQESGVLVTRVEQDGPAAKAGVKAGDVILKVGDSAVREGSDLREALGKLEPGSSVTLTVQREGQPLELKVTLGGTTAGRRSGVTL